MKYVLFFLLVVLFERNLYSQIIHDDCPISFVNEYEEKKIKALLPIASQHNKLASNLALKQTAFSYNFYYGNLHSHSAYSDGDNDNVCPTTGTSATCCYSIGDGAMNYDFMGISDHNHNTSPSVMSIAKFNSGLSECAAYNSSAAGTNFATFYGLEWGVISTGGHALVYGTNKLIGWQAGNYNIFVSQGDYRRLFFVMDSLNGFCTLAHPNINEFDSIFSITPYNAIWDRAIVGVSLENGPSTSTITNYTDPPASAPDEVRYKDLLKKGYHVGPIIDLDNHNSNAMGKSNQGRTVVLENSLSPTSITNGYKNMRFFASEDYNVQTLFDANSVFIMGSITTQISNPVLNVSITDPDVGDNVSKIEIFYGEPGSGTAATILTSNTSSSTLTYTHAIAGSGTYYYYAKITQTDGHRIWTSPIWYTKNVTLPIELVSFDVIKKDHNNVLVTWKTASENNCKNFSILKSSNNTITFLPLNTVSCSNNNYGSEYSIIDDKVDLGIYYYKLIEETTDNRKIDYGIKSIELFSNHYSPTIYVDHDNNSCIISGLNNINQNTKVSVYDIIGKKIEPHIIKNLNTIQIENLPNGVFLIQIESEYKLLNFKINLFN